MKKSLGRTIAFSLLGSAIVIGGVALYLYTDENARNHVQGIINREKAKLYVRYKLNGSDALVNAVDKLSDTEINTLVKLADSAGSAKDSAQSTLSNLMNKAQDVGQEVSERLSEHF